MFVVRRCPQPATVALDDRVADRQSDAHTAVLRRIERLKKLAFALRLNTDARILHRQSNVAAVISLRPQEHHSRPVLHAPQGVARVEQKVHDHLLDLNSIAQDLRDVAG